MRFLTFLRLGALLAVAVASVSSGSTIASVGPGSPYPYVGPGDVLDDRVYSFGWSQSVTYDNVVVSVSVYDYWFFATGGTLGGGGVAGFLTDKVGPGTTALNELASTVAVPYAPGHVGALTIFSGLTLGPGNYNVTLRGITGFAQLYMSVYDPPTVVVAPGISLLEDGFYCCTAFGYGPELPLPELAGFPAAFEVTGDLAQGAAVPEPSTMVLCLGGLIVLVGARMRRRSL